MSKQVNYNENLCSGAAIRDDKGRRISKLFEASHPKMTVGYAKNLIMPDTPTEQEFNFRQSGGGVIEGGVAVIDKVKGNSVVWNQLINSGNGGSLAGVTFTKNGLAYVLNGTCTAEQNFEVCRDLQVINGHKYCLASNSSVVSVTSWENPMVLNANKFFGDIATAMASGGTRIFIDLTNGTTYNNVVVLPVIYDLTQMFGAGNEPTTYEEFLSRKPKIADEYAYNEGTIVNNKVEKVVTTGKNLWDEEWENGFIEGGTGMPGSDGSSTSMRSKHFIPIIGGQNYYMSKDTQAFSYEIYWFEYDANFAFLGRSAYIQTLSAKSNTAYVRVGLYVTTSGVTVTPATAPKTCINLSDPAINGQYFPYEKHELDLSWVKDIKDIEGVKLFEDGMRSAGTAFDEVAKGKAIKRIGVYTFNGTEDWIINTYAQEKGVTAYQCYSGLKPINDNIRCDRFVTGSWGNFAPMSIFAIPSNGIVIETDGTQSLADFKASLEAKPLDVYYELAEPVEVEYDEKNLTYPVVAGGTEEAVAIEPSTAFRADIGYGIDAVKTILDLKARVEALEGK